MWTRQSFGGRRLLIICFRRRTGTGEARRAFLYALASPPPDGKYSPSHFFFTQLSTKLLKLKRRHSAHATSWKAFSKRRIAGLHGCALFGLLKREAMCRVWQPPTRCEGE